MVDQRAKSLTEGGPAARWTSVLDGLRLAARFLTPELKIVIAEHAEELARELRDQVGPAPSANQDGSSQMPAWMRW